MRRRGGVAVRPPLRPRRPPSSGARVAPRAPSPSPYRGGRPRPPRRLLVLLPLRAGPGFFASPILVPRFQSWLRVRVVVASWASCPAVVRCACRHTLACPLWWASSAGCPGLTACPGTPCHGLAGTPRDPPQAGCRDSGWLPAGHPRRRSSARGRRTPGVAIECWVTSDGAFRWGAPSGAACRAAPPSPGVSLSCRRRLSGRVRG